MAARHHNRLSAKATARESGQAIVEFSLVMFILFFIVFAIIDFSRAIYDLQVMSGLTREGSNLASRGTDLPSTVATLIAESTTLDLQNNGRVIVTAVTNNGGTKRITGQVSQGGISAGSKVGQGVGTAATLPAAAASMLGPNQTIYVTEVFYSYESITPIGQLFNLTLPSPLYDVAYF
jgi:Flp pilus assembly protein TadG